MYCAACGKAMEEDARFCQHCGAVKAATKASGNDNKRVDSPQGAKSSSDKLWEKFTEIYSTDEGRKRYEHLVSNEAWQLLDALSTNTFESFIEEHKKIPELPAV